MTEDEIAHYDENDDCHKTDHRPFPQAVGIYTLLLSVSEPTQIPKCFKGTLPFSQVADGPDGRYDSLVPLAARRVCIIPSHLSPLAFSTIIDYHQYRAIARKTLSRSISGKTCQGAVGLAITHSLFFLQ